MIDINEFEEGVLIEANDFNMPVQRLVADIQVRAKKLPDVDIYKLASNIIGSLYVQEQIKLVITTYEEQEEDLYTPVSEREPTQEELDLILKHPEKWEEQDVFSLTEVYELCITDKGRDALDF